ncbi:MAG: hypothetical protein AAB513_03105 [Patescibacteria group bacterium]
MQNGKFARFGGMMANKISRRRAGLTGKSAWAQRKKDNAPRPLDLPGGTALCYEEKEKNYRPPTHRRLSVCFSGHRAGRVFR